MDIYVRDRNLKIIDLIDDAQSVIWTTRFYECGDFELYMIANEKNLNKVRQGYFLTREDDDAIMVIEHINIKTNIEDGNYLTVSGRCVESLLERRCMVYHKASSSMQNSSLIHALFTMVLNDMHDTNDSHRIISIIANDDKYFKDILPKDKSTVKINHYNYLGNYLDTLLSICKAEKYGLGFKLDKINGEPKLFLAAFKGVDRSSGQTELPRVIFSNEYSNLLNSNYDKNSADFKNCAIVFGEGEGYDRKMTQAWHDENNKSSDLDLYEMFVDARDISSKGEGDTTLSDEDYRTLLINRGKEKLSEQNIIEEFDGEVAPDINYEYKKDYFLGDVVTIENEYGISQTVRITAITECEDENGYYYIPTFTTEV